MKACLYIGGSGNAWVREMLPGKSPGELPLAGKSWCRHAVDLCSLLNVTEVYVADGFFYEDLRSRIGNGDYWNLKLHLQQCGEYANHVELLKSIPELENSDDDLLLFWGQVLPDIADAERLLEAPRPVVAIPDRLPDGIWLLRGGRLYECAVPLHRMDSPKSYFDLNFRLLNDHGIYTLPCYSAEPGVNIGRNVVMMPHYAITPPVIIQDNCVLGFSVSLRNGVIIGHEVLVDDSSVIDHSIILDGTCIGKHLFIRDKIISGNTVIDADSGTCAEISDHLLVSRSRPRGFGRYAIAEFLLALTTALVLTPLYILARPFKRHLEKLAFFKYMLRVYPKCWGVVFGKTRLVRVGIDNTDYAFRYSDQWLKHQSDHQRDLADVCFFNHRSVRVMFAVVATSLLKRLVTISETPSGSSAKGESRR